MMQEPVLRVTSVTKVFPGGVVACRDVSLDVHPGEVVGIVGESGSGKSTLLRCIAGRTEPDWGRVAIATEDTGPLTDIWDLDEVARAQVLRANVGLVHQNPRDGLQLDVTAGGNVAEPLMVQGNRRYASLRQTALSWLRRVEIPTGRVDDLPGFFSGGMQQRLQIARNLASSPKLLLLDEPTGGLDVSVQARLLDLLRVIVRDLDLAVVVVTHDLAVARMLAHRLLVMRRGRTVEMGLTDQVLDDPQAAYSQLLVSAVLRV